MTDQVSRVARATARRLTTELGSSVVADVEAALHDRRSGRTNERYVDPIALGALIVSVATFAWGVYKDLRRNAAHPDPDVVARTVRVELRAGDASAADQRDHVVDIVVSETIRVAEEQGADDQASNG